ncbi:site-specific integrase [Clostridia bacterium OttesenSCG-928-O13]|nr:site-specific integrase [Clostridia bacterium OttesenSCG-928-O13]
MPVYKDKERGTWFCKFYYTDWQGVKKAKQKRGFLKQKDAKDWERAFLDRQQENPQMMFSSLVDLYLDDIKNRIRRNTYETKEHIIEKKVRPFFGKMPLDTIKPTTIRKWQNELINDNYSETYLKTINNQLSALLNYAVKYYGLRENPCHKAGSMGKKHAQEMQFWTRDEYTKFSKALEGDTQMHVIFQVLYWCGLRLGEMLALTVSDIDFEANTLSVNKSLQRIGREDVVTEPKTPKSNRIIAMPAFLSRELKSYIDLLYKPSPETKLFTTSKSGLRSVIIKYSAKANVHRIRVHDLRHSHASLLIELGFSPLLIAERLGHENIQTTLDTYSHLYPHKQTELAQKLDELELSVS